MTYCLGIVTKFGLIMASDSRTNAGYDQINTTRKMYTFVQPGERVFVLLCSGSLSLSQSIMTLLRRGWGGGKGVVKSPFLYRAPPGGGGPSPPGPPTHRAGPRGEHLNIKLNIFHGGPVARGPA